MVTKFDGGALISELYALGVRDVGENRQQELTAKCAELGGLAGVRWHFIGQAKNQRACRPCGGRRRPLVDQQRIADAPTEALTSWPCAGPARRRAWSPTRLLRPRPNPGYTPRERPESSQRLRWRVGDASRGSSLRLRFLP